MTDKIIVSGFDADTNAAKDVELLSEAGKALVTFSGGGAAATTTLLSAVTATGAGTSVHLPTGKCTFQAIANGTAGAFSASVNVEVSNNDTNWELLSTISLSGTATTADSDGFVSDSSWAYVRGNVTAISGTNASLTLIMAV